VIWPKISLIWEFVSNYKEVVIPIGIENTTQPLPWLLIDTEPRKVMVVVWKKS
jgi:hypothetical protein